MSLGQTNRFPDLRKRDEASASLPVTQVGDTYRDGTTALIMAAQLRHTEIVKSLIEADANVDSRDQQRGTSLMYVGKRSHMGIGKYPVTANSDVTSDNNQDYTSLMYAEQNKHSEVVKHLSEAQAIVCSQDQTVITPLSADPGVRYNEKYLACGKPDAALENNDVNTPVTVVPEKETKRDTKGKTYFPSLEHSNNKEDNTTYFGRFLVVQILKLHCTTIGEFLWYTTIY